MTNKEENEKSHFRKDNVKKLEECSVGKIKIFNFIMNTLYSVGVTCCAKRNSASLVNSFLLLSSKSVLHHNDRGTIYIH